MPPAELTMVMTHDEAEKRYCPFSIAHGKSYCEASGCHGWRWLPGQRDVYTAKGFCGMPSAPIALGVAHSTREISA
jgi:hypothetical protein